VKKVIFLLVSFFSVSVFAEEGMWLLTQLDQLGLKEKGLEIETEDIYHPDKTSLTDAIVWLGGCSASFVSPEGLLLTNHHCAYGALQRASSGEKDYIKNGFLAKTRADEIEARGSNAYVLQEIKDVTQKVLGTVQGVNDPVDQEKKITAKIKTMEDNIEGDKEDVYAYIASMYKGKQYLLFIYKKYQDVRIVYAPPKSIGKYGGDVDNWMWPRHTGDFTFLRVYQAPDGTGAKYHPDNIPVKPKNYLRVATEPLREGDFTFILGFPGSTNRWRTSNSVAWNMKYTYPETIQEYHELIELMDELTKDSPEGKIRVASRNAGLNNTMKNFQGNLDGMKKTGFLDNKIAFENELMNFIHSDAELEQKFGRVLSDVKALYDELGQTREKDNVLSQFGYRAGTLSSLAIQIYDIARERAKPAKDRDPDFNEKDVKRTIDRLHLRYYSYYEPVDKAMLKRTLEKANELAGESRIAGLEYLLTGATHIDDFVEDAYANTLLDSVEYARSLFEKSLKELEQLDDPLIQMAASLYTENQELEDRNKQFNAKIQDARKTYLSAVYEYKGTGLYPDANGTMRFTYGHIAGYKPADAIQYEPFTTLAGVIAKDTGNEPFDMPRKLKTLYDAKDYGQWAHPDFEDVSVNFTHRCDITGGNSGSAVMNARGELIGLAFDGNYEAMTSDWQYDYDMQRTISVDIRYVLFITEKFAGARHLLTEMGID
jgi:hypothetical protein